MEICRSYTTITFEYRLLDKETDYKKLKFLTFSSREDCKAYLTAIYDSISRFDQAAAKFDFDLTLGMVTDINLNDITSLKLKAGEKFTMPFGFESKKYSHWLDIVITAQGGLHIC